MDVSPGRPVRLVLTPVLKQPARTSLVDWIHQRPEYRAGVKDTQRNLGGRAAFSDGVIIAIVAHALLPGLFDLLKTWLAQQSGEAIIRVRVADSEVEVQVTGRTDVRQLLTDVIRTVRELDDRGAGAAPGPHRSGQAIPPHSKRPHRR